MDKTFKFLLPSPNFSKNAKDACKPKPHYLTPSGMSLLPREKQPPPMYGKQGATLPARYLKQQAVKEVVALDADRPPEKQYCEPCELELHSLEDLKRHRAQHEKCPVAGCHYTLHPSIMDKHINTLHACGSFDKFKKLSTPEEIAAWREERRKRYPTLANVLLKQKAKEQRQKRGERLELNKNRFGKINDRKRAQPNNLDDQNNTEEKKHRDESKTNHKNSKNKKSKNKVPKPKVQNEQLKEETLDEERVLSSGGIIMFRGTSHLEDYKHLNDKKKAVTNNALFGLVGMYGSDDDYESEENDCCNDNHVEKLKTVEEADEIKSKCDNKSSEQPENSEIVATFYGNRKVVRSSFNNELNEVSNSEIVKDFSKYSIDSDVIEHTVNNIEYTANTITNELVEHDTSTQNGNLSDEAPEEMPIQRSIPNYPLKSVSNPKISSFDESEVKRVKIDESRKTSKRKQLTTKRKFGLDYRKARLRKQNTMLEKLLESDIRHERNVLLQCVRYVCENNFFDIAQNKNQVNMDKNKL